MSLAAQLPALQVVVPLVTAPVVALLRGRGAAWAAATAASVAAFAVALGLALQIQAGGPISYEMGDWPAPYGIVLELDAFNTLLLLVVTGASTLALLGGRAVIDAEIAADRQPLFFTAWLIALAGYCGILITGDAFNVFVFMEISSLATYVIVANGPDRQALTATFKYLVMGTLGATFYLIGVGLIYMMTGTLNLADMDYRLAGVTETTPVLLAAGFVTVGLALKAAIFPLHMWMPNAYTFAPSAVAVFLAACSTKVQLYVLLRFDFTVFQTNLAEHGLQFAGFLAPAAALAFLVGSSVAMFERDLKRMLGYSSVGQLGYIVLGASFLSVLGLTAGIVHLFNHALIKGALFLAAAALALRFGTTRLDAIAGAGRAMPFTMGAFVIAGLSIIGIPGTAGFVSKWVLLQAAFEAGALGVFLAVLVLISSLMAVVYVWRVVETAYFKPAADDALQAREAPVAILAPLWLLAGANVYFGLDTDFTLGMARSAAETLLGAGS